MARQKTQKRRPVKSIAAKGRTAPPLRRTPPFGRTDLLILLTLGVVTFAIYAQVMGHRFITLDDPTYIQENPMVNRGVTLLGLAWAFTTFYATNWHPLTWISHMLDCQLFGTNAGPHFLVNALIHVANTLLLFWFLLRTTRARWPSALIAALFALHPLHVESVAWASERKDTLSTAFGFLCLLSYQRYVSAPSWKRYGFVALSLPLGLMAKPMLVTWPFVLLLLDYWPFARLASRPAISARALWPLIREKLPLLLVVVPSACVTYIAQAQGGAVSGLNIEPFSWRLANALRAYAKYLYLTFCPRDLALYYPTVHDTIPAWQW